MVRMHSRWSDSRIHCTKWPVLGPVSSIFDGVILGVPRNGLHVFHCKRLALHCGWPENCFNYLQQENTVNS